MNRDTHSSETIVHMNREQMIAWLTLEGWQPETNAVFHDDGCVVYAVRGFMREDYAAHYYPKLNREAIYRAPRGFRSMHTGDLKLICDYIEKNQERLTL